MRNSTLYKIVGSGLIALGGVEVIIGDKIAAAVALICGYDTLLHSRHADVNYAELYEVGYRVGRQISKEVEKFGKKR